MPTLVAVGEHDNLMCGPPDGITCTDANVHAHETPVLLPGRQPPSRRHPLHRTAPYTTTLIHTWLSTTLPT